MTVEMEKIVQVSNEELEKTIAEVQLTIISQSKMVLEAHKHNEAALTEGRAIMDKLKAENE